MLCLNLYFQAICCCTHICYFKQGCCQGLVKMGWGTLPNGCNRTLTIYAVHPHLLALSKMWEFWQKNPKKTPSQISEKSHFQVCIFYLFIYTSPAPSTNKCSLHTFASKFIFGVKLWFRVPCPPSTPLPPDGRPLTKREERQHEDEEFMDSVTTSVLSMSKGIFPWTNHEDASTDITLAPILNQLNDHTSVTDWWQRMTSEDVQPVIWIHFKRTCKC